MDTKALARWIGRVANVLVTASVFFVLIWWRISAYLFVVGGALFGLAWLLGGAAAPAPATAQE